MTRHCLFGHVRAKTCLHRHSIFSTHACPLQVFALPHLSPVSCDPEPTPFSIDRDRPLYALHGGSVMMGRPLEALGVAVGAAEVVVLYKDKLRLHDFAAT